MPAAKKDTAKTKTKTKKKSSSGKRKQTAWMLHLKKVQQDNPGKSLGDCMVIASKSYKRE